MRFIAASLLGLAALASVDTGNAYFSANVGSSTFYSRNCHDEKVIVRQAKPTEPSPSAFVPVRRISAPSALQVVPHTVDDAAYAEPVPVRAGGAPDPPQVVVTHLTVESQNHWGCLGIQRGKAGILRALDAPPGTRFYGHPYVASFIGDNMLAALAFDLKEAIVPIRKILDRPPVTGEIDRLSLRAEAAHALAMLDDRESIPKLEALATELESAHLVFVWRSTFLSLVQLDPEAASRYATGLLERMASAKPPERVTSDDLPTLLPHILPRDASRAMPSLKKLSGPYQLPNSYPNHAGCYALATRIRLGDEAMAKVVRPAVEGSLDNNLATVCYSQLVEVLAPGKDIKELPILVHRARYEELAALALSLHGKPDSRDRAQLLKGLRKLAQSAASQFANRKGSYGISSQYGYMLSALALAGDTKAIAELDALIESPDDTGDAPWIAARFAVLGDLPGATARAKKRLEIGMREGIDHGNLDTMGVGVAVGEGVRLLRALASKKDPLFSLGLLVRDTNVREEAMLTLSREKPVEACAIVTSEARKATDDTVNNAFWAMSVLGPACRANMEQLVRDGGVPEHVSGMALEHLAMTRAQGLAALAGKWQSAHEHSVHLERANIIMMSPE